MAPPESARAHFHRKLLVDAISNRSCRLALSHWHGGLRLAPRDRVLAASRRPLGLRGGLLRRRARRLAHRRDHHRGPGRAHLDRDLQHPAGRGLAHPRCPHYRQDGLGPARDRAGRRRRGPLARRRPPGGASRRLPGRRPGVVGADEYAAGTSPGTIAAGGGAETPAAYVRALDLGAERLEQTYARLPGEPGHHRYRYAAPAFDFTCTLVYDESGLVLDYPGIAVRAR